MTLVSCVASDQDLSADRPEPVTEAGEPIADAVRGRNINEKTFLATDYLNHFNEIVMLLELVPDMPDCLEDAKEWVPKTYPEHFRDSGFSDKELAILAYEHAPARYREPFDETIAHMNALVADGLARIEGAILAEDPAQLADVTETVCGHLRRLTDIANGIIHGFDTTVDQAEIDRIFAR